MDVKSLRPWQLRGAPLVLTLCLLTLLCGCSARKLVYNLADRLLARQIDRTLRLDSDQRRDMEGRVRTVLAWHRAQELPRYAVVLRDLQVKVRDGTTRDEVLWLVDQASAAIDRFAERFAPEAGAVLAGLRPDQVAHVDAEFRRRTKERFERLERPEDEYLRHQVARGEKAVRTWLGSVTPAQHDLIVAFAREGRPYEIQREQNMQRNRHDFITALQARPGAAALSSLMRDWLVHQQIQPTAAFQRVDQQSRARFLDLLVALDAVMTAQQRQHLLRELGSLQRDVIELAGRG